MRKTPLFIVHFTKTFTDVSLILINYQMELISLSISDQPASTHEQGSAETDESRAGKIPNIESIPITAHLGRKCLDTTEHMGTT